MIGIDVGCREDVGARLFKKVVGVGMKDFRPAHLGDLRSVNKGELRR